MFPKFNDDVKKILVAAKREMFELKHPYVGSEHLLLAILNYKSEESFFLNSNGIMYEQFKNKLIEVVGIGKKSNNWFLFTPMLKRILENASVYYKDYNNEPTEGVLLHYLFSEGDGIAVRIVAMLDVDMKIIYDRYSKIENFNDYSSLNKYGYNMNTVFENKKYDNCLYGREDEIESIITILLRKNKNNPILVGDAGVGKTAIIEELDKRIVKKMVPKELFNYTIYNISVSSIVSGTKYRGEFEERFNLILDSIKNKNNIIIFIDEIHTLIGAGGAEGAIDASNILKPFLARGEIKLIGATTCEEFDKYIAKDKAFVRRFDKVIINEVDRSTLEVILLKNKSYYESFHNIVINDDVISTIIDYSYRYINNGKMPDKVFDFLDELCSYVHLKSSYNKEIVLLREQIVDLVNEKNKAIVKKDFGKANKIKSKEDGIRNLLDKSYSINYSNSITFADLKLVLYKKTGISLTEIECVDMQYKKISKKIIGNRDLILSLLNYLKFKFVNSINGSSILITGHKGVGKKTFIYQYVEVLRLNNYFIEIDLKDDKLYYDYYDYKYNNSNFFDYIINNNFTVVFFKNIEYCSSKSYNILSNILLNKRIKLINNSTVKFDCCLFFCTIDSNANIKTGFNNNKSIIYTDSICKMFEKQFSFYDLTISNIKSIIKQKIIENKIECSNSLINRIYNLIDYDCDGVSMIDSIIKGNIYEETLIKC